jgi:uncharacterized protein (TIGR02996 family)
VGRRFILHVGYEGGGRRPAGSSFYPFPRCDGLAMNTLDSLLAGIVADPQDEVRWLVLADYVEEHDDPRRAELLRLHRRLLATCCQPDEHPERATWQARIVELLGRGVMPCVPQRSLLLGDGLEMTFSFVPPGSFLMGSPEDEVERCEKDVRHRVTLTAGFWMATNPVTRTQWAAVMQTASAGGSFPVEKVSWHDCQEFCRRLGEKARLPTAAEWEWACRAGTTTAFFFGDTLTTGQANWNSHPTYQPRKGKSRATPVGRFPPNAWGLFDMHGNVWEWCRDLYEGTLEDQFMTGNVEGSRGVRGGCSLLSGSFCRSAHHAWMPPDEPEVGNGCRVCLSIE